MNEVINEVEQVETDIADVEQEIVETEDVADDESETADGGEDETDSEQGRDVKKLKSSNQRKDRKINKLYAQKKQLEERLAALEIPEDNKSVNPDDFEQYGDYMKAEMEALVDNKQKQTQTESEKAYLTQQKEQLMVERNQYLAKQAQEAARGIPDFYQVITPQQTQILDELPEAISDIFYGIENAPLAAYVLAKEGKLEGLAYSHPQIAANEIWSAQQRGITMMLKPRTQTTQAPQPMKSVRGTGTTTKNLADGDVLRNLGLKS